VRIACQLVSVGAASDYDKHARSIRTIVPYELESVEGDEGGHMVRKGQ